MDAIALLEQDHETIESLFAKFEDAGPRARKTKQRLVERIVKELVVHAEIEELHFYPAVREELPDLRDEVLEDLEEHHVVEVLLAELDGMDADHERFDAKVAVLIENVRHHVEEEEQELFPKVRKGLGKERLAELGEALKEAKRTAPTRPHPWSPDEPPGNVIAGLFAGAADRARDAASRRS